MKCIDQAVQRTTSSVLRPSIHVRTNYKTINSVNVIVLLVDSSFCPCFFMKS